MSRTLSNILFPLAVASMVTAQSLVSGGRAEEGDMSSYKPFPVKDTVIYDIYGYRKGWEPDEMPQVLEIADSLLSTEDIFDQISDSVEVQIDSVETQIDSLADDQVSEPELTPEEQAALDSIAFVQWYDSLSVKERKAYDKTKKEELKQMALDSLKLVRDSVAAYKDSVKKNTPRILDTYFLPDTARYVRISSWTHTRDFHRIEMLEDNANYEYHFYDYPFRREDVNATWLGVAGSPVQNYDFFKRESREGVSFYDALESWAYSPQTLPFYNTKTPYTELAYYGTLFSTESKMSDNIRIMTTQNISPAWNMNFTYDKFGGYGMLENENTKNKNLAFSTNYVGKKYLLHAGYIYNMVSRGENEGIIDNSFIRDTVVDSREIAVLNTEAKSLVKKNTVFLDQQYRIPFTFLKKHSKGDDSLDFKNVTTAFIGHSSEYSTYKRTYTSRSGLDSLWTSKLENRAFIRLQPWSSEAIVSKLDAGIGNRIWNYYSPDFLEPENSTNERWNSTYAYAGVEGQFRKYFHWNASADYVFLGKEMNDFSINGNALIQFYPFRKARTSPVNLKFSVKSEFQEPDFYQQHFNSSRYNWNNEFSKTSQSSLSGSIEIPRWRTSLSASYGLLDHNLYYDGDGIIRQNNDPMSVFTATLDNDLKLGLLHLNHKVLFQKSTNEDVVPLPLIAVNAKYYLQFSVVKEVMDMQVGMNIWYNTAWYAPGWNPVMGVFHNQTEEKYGNAPYADAFVNIQWKRASIFVKWENVGMGMLTDTYDYFSAHHFINTQRAVKFGIFWPFYNLPAKEKGSAAEAASTGRLHVH